MKNFYPFWRFLYLSTLAITTSIFSECNNGTCTSACPLESKTFFRTRSIIEDVSLFLGLNQYNYYRKYFEPNDFDCNKSQKNIVTGIFFQKSEPNNQRDVAHFFFPGSNVDQTPNPQSGQIESVVTISPRRRTVGVYLDYHQDFCCHGMNFWFDIKGALYQAAHSLNAQETILSTDSTLEDACTPLEFLNSNNLKFGKIANCTLTRLGVDDVELKFGYYFLNNIDGGYYEGFYGSLLIPTASKPNSRFLFEPLVGRGHTGLGIGFNGGFSSVKADMYRLNGILSTSNERNSLFLNRC